MLQKGMRSEGVEVFHVSDEFGRGTPDEELIPKIAQKHGIFITQDKMIRQRVSQWQMCLDYKLGVLFIEFPRGGYTYWQQVSFFVKKWGKIKEKTKDLDKPFAFKVTPSKIERLLT